MTDKLTIALAQMNQRVGDLEANAAAILAMRGKAAGADLLLVPELQLTGYPPEDLVLKPEFVRRTHEWTDKLVAATVDPGPALLFGTIVSEDGITYPVRPVSPLGGDRETLKGKIDMLQGVSGTPLYDALNTAHRYMQARAKPGRINAIIVLSDGEDMNSQISLDDLKRQLRGPTEGNDPAPVRVFPIIYGQDAPPKALEEIAEASGGQVFNASDPRRIKLVFQQVVNNF